MSQGRPVVGDAVDQRIALVGGSAEQLLLPVLADRLGRPLAAAGVTVINVDGVSFAAFITLFSASGLSYRCAVVCGADARPPVKDEHGRSDGDPALSTSVRVFRSQKTVEWDIVRAGNWAIALEALRRLRPRAAARLEAHHRDASAETQADQLLAAIAGHEGRFAQALVTELEGERELGIPRYLADAIAWLTEDTPCVHSNAPPGVRGSRPTAGC